MFDYDVVVIGNQIEAIRASRQAIAAGLRVTLVSQNKSWSYPHSLGLLLQVCRDGEGQTWEQALTQYHKAHQWLSWKNSEFELGTAGIDLIVDHGQFVPGKPLKLVTNDRCLISPCYLLAMGQTWSVPADLPPNTITPDRLPLMEKLPQRLAIVGSTPEAIGIAPYLSRWGCELYLICGRDALLPQENAELNQLLSHHLEAEGVKLYPLSLLDGIKKDLDTMVLSLGDRKVQVDRVMASQPSYGHLETLNLPNFSIKWADRQGLTVNQYLQTQHPQIYGCGSLLGGYGQPEVANYEIDYLVQRFCPHQKFTKETIHYDRVAYYLPTWPEVGRVGFNAQQLKDRDCAFRTWVFAAETDLYGQLTEQSPLQGRIYTDQKNRILGAELIGSQVKQFLPPIAIALQQGLEIDNIRSFFPDLICEKEV